RSERWQGRLDTLALFEMNLKAFTHNLPEAEVAPVQASIDAMRQRTEFAKGSPEQWAATMNWLNREGWTELSARLVDLISSKSMLLSSEVVSDLRISSGRLQQHITNMQRDFDLLLPWLLPLNQPPRFFREI